MKTVTLLLSALVVYCTITEMTSTSRITRQTKLCEDVEIPQATTRVSYDKSGNLMKVHFVCNQGYSLIGSTEIVCKDGNWSSEAPSCIRDCGKALFAPDPTSLIINGEPSKQGAWPWQVALALDFDTLKLPKQIEQPNGTFTAIPVIDGWGIACGAALINSQWVLTTAVCVTNLQSGVQSPKNSVMVYAGKHFRDNLQDDPKRVQARKALNIFVHDDFDYTTLKADIALILLEEPIVFTQWVLPVCLPTAPWDFQKNEVIGMIAGWGMTEDYVPSNELQQAKLKWAPPAECAKTFPESNIKEGMFCGIPPGEPSLVETTANDWSCFGNSGSPLVFPVGAGENRHWVVKGLLSWGARNCSSAIFTEVRNYVNWINTFVPPLS